MVSSLILLVHFGATAAMAGLIWFVQLVHYPLFAGVGRSEFVRYEADHQRRTAWVVGPFMMIEGVTAVLLVVAPGQNLERFWPVVGLVLLAVVHASTIFLQVPRHGHLSAGYDGAVVSSLVATNWIRTVVWSLRSFVAAGMLLIVLP